MAADVLATCFLCIYSGRPLVLQTKLYHRKRVLQRVRQCMKGLVKPRQLFIRNKAVIDILVRGDDVPRCIAPSVDKPSRDDQQ